MIKQRIVPTLSLMGSGLAIGIIAGVLLGVISAVKQYSVLDFILTILAFLGASTPAFFAGLLGLYIFSLRLGWFPAGGLATPGVPFSLWDHLDHLILPALMLSLFQVSSIMRYTRSAMPGVLTQVISARRRRRGYRGG